MGNRSRPSPVRPFAHSPVLPFLALALLSALPYFFTLGHEFVYDDHGQIVENSFLKNPANVRELLTLQTLRDPAVVNGRRPAVLLSYFTDRGLWGNRSVGFHLTNVLLHAGTVLLLYVFLRRLAADAGTRAPGAFAWVAAVLFGVHPLLTEAIQVPSFRPDILYTLFLLLHLMLVRSIVDRYSGHWVLRVVGVGLTMLGTLASKEAGVVAPVLVTAMWFFFPRARPERGTMAIVLGLDALLLAVFTVLCSGGAPWQAMGASWNGLSLPVPENLLTSPWIWTLYLGLMVCPHPLIADRIVAPVTSVGSAHFLVGLLVTAGCVAAVIVGRRKIWLGFGMSWLLITYLPVSNLVPLINPMAERYAYGMLVGFSILISWAFDRGPVRMRHVLVSVLVVAALVTSMHRLGDWENDETLWRRTVADEPNSARAHIWVGLAHKRAQRLDEAVTSLETADRVNPQNTAALINLAIIRGQAGDLRGAEDLLREAVKRRPDRPDVYWNLAIDLELQEREEEALDVLRQGLAINPWHLRTRRMLTEKLLVRGEFKDALELVEGTLDIDPADEESRLLRDRLRRNVP